MIVLPIKRIWFDKIKSGEKKEEYREFKEYYHSRFKKYMPKRVGPHEDIAPMFEVVFRNGYEHNSPKIKCKCIVDVGEGKQEWGAIPGQTYYILKILEVLEVRNDVQV